MGDHVKILRAILATLALACAAGCSKEPPPPSVEAFMEDPILLDATMVRCVASRNSINYDPECVNAREAVERIAAREEQARRAALEAESQRKREARRRALEAADEARRRAEELERQRREAELLGLGPAPETGVAPPVDETVPPDFPDDPDAVAAPLVTVEEVPLPAGVVEPPATMPGDSYAEEQPAVAPAATDLGQIRQELEERRQEQPPESS